MINILSQNGHTTYGLKEYVLDTPEDLKYLPIEGNKPGSTAFIISTCQVFMLNSKGEWKEI